MSKRLKKLNILSNTYKKVSRDTTLLVTHVTNMDIFKSKAQKIKKIGENIASRYLLSNGFSIIEKNFSKKSEEIDVIAKKDDKYYFLEIKPVSCETLPEPEDENPFEGAEEKIHPIKIKRLKRAIERYFIRHRMGNIPWQFDVIMVYLNLKNKKSRVKKLENILI